jgi:hypothetical protein
MAIYIYKNNQQSGPFADADALNGLRSGLYSPNDMACRTGMKEWRPLSLLCPSETQAIQNVFQAAQPKQPKCLACGYVGAFKKPPFIYMRDLIISIVLFAVAGAGIIWFIISVLQKKPMSCPNCKAKGSFPYDY